jgi:PTH1 family peptidyl-tRNA hydrolase
MFMIVGLGNIGEEYENTRHNAGFMVVDILSKRWKIVPKKIKYQAFYNKGIVQRNGIKETVILAKPLTYMNLSGRAVKPLQYAFEVPTDHIIVVHDDLDLPVGIVRIKKGGGDGGHKGLYSIISLIGPAFIRVRVGIGRPKDREDVVDYVLSPFKKSELDIVNESLVRAADAVEDIIFLGLDKAQTIYNVRT